MITILRETVGMTRTYLKNDVYVELRNHCHAAKHLYSSAQLCHFFRADVKLGTAVAKGLGVDVDAIMKELKHESAKI